MADIELVIKIPEEKELIDRAIWGGVSAFDTENLAIILKAIVTGTPLPKGHGRLIDADKFISEHFGEVARLVDDAPTIIEADKGDKE